MPFYEIILKAEVRKTLTVQAQDYGEAVARAAIHAHDALAADLASPTGLPWEVERFLVLDDEEVVRERAKGVL